jgi:hypothetical protein
MYIQMHAYVYLGIYIYVYYGKGLEHGIAVVTVVIVAAAERTTGDAS